MEIACARIKQDTLHYSMPILVVSKILVIFIINAVNPHELLTHHSSKSIIVSAKKFTEMISENSSQVKLANL